MTNSATIVQRVWNDYNLLRDPDVLAAEIVEDLRGALEQFAAIAEELDAE